MHGKYFELLRFARNDVIFANLLAMTGKLLAMTNLAPTLTDFEFALMWIASSLRSPQ